MKVRLKQQVKKRRLASINTPELRGIKSDPIAAIKAKDYLKKLLTSSSGTIKQIYKENSKEQKEVNLRNKFLPYHLRYFDQVNSFFSSKYLLCIIHQLYISKP